MKLSLVLQLCLLIILGTVLRFTALDRYPTSLSVDEVSIGYDAYSLLLTGKDHHQQPFPLVFKSLGDFKSPLYIYLTTLPVRLFGLNELSTRFTSAFFGVLGIVVIYSLTYSLTKSKSTSLLTTFVYTVLPWSIRISRGAYEANVALILSMLAFNFLLLRKSFIGLGFMLLTLLTYHSPKLFLVLLVPIIWHHTRPKITRASLIPLILIVLFLFSPGTFTRALPTNITRDPEIKLAISNTTHPNIITSSYLYFVSAVSRYFQYLDPSFLFTKGLNLTLTQDFDHGILYLIDAPLFIIGVYLFLKKPNLLVLLWTLLAPIPAVVTLNDYHFIRTLPLIFSYSLFIAIGLKFILNKFTWSKFVYPLLIIISLVHLSDLYLVHFPAHKSDESFDPSKEIALYSLKKHTNYTQIVIDPAFGKSSPNIQGAPELYILFYGQLHPEIYWTTKHDLGFANYSFRHIEWFKHDEYLTNTLFIGSTWSLPPEKIPQNKVLHTFFFSNHQPAYYSITP